MTRGDSPVSVSSQHAKPTVVTIFGATGRMGRALVRAIAGDAAFHLGGGTASPDSHEIGADAGTVAGIEPSGVLISAAPAAALSGVDVAIEFALAGATRANLEACVAAGCPLLIGTTGLDADLLQRIDRASKDIPVLVAPNTSLGVNVLVELVTVAARQLSEAFDVEIVEAHHRDKRDAPSGTALRLGEAVAASRGDALERLMVLDRLGVGTSRRPGSIGFAAIRGGDIVGEHTVIFAGPGERVELGHRVTDRQVFVRGALKAAHWLVGRSPGRYGMADVLDHGS